MSGSRASRRRAERRELRKLAKDSIKRLTGDPRELSYTEARTMWDKGSPPGLPWPMMVSGDTVTITGPDGKVVGWYRCP